MKFGAISWKIDILSTTAELKFVSKYAFAHNNNCDYLPHTTFRFYFVYLIDFRLNVDFPSQFALFYR